jgi:hypothetical protein
MERSHRQDLDRERVERTRDLAGRIGKLRWLGMQQEAEALHMTLQRVPGTDCVVVIPRDTD